MLVGLGQEATGGDLGRIRVEEEGSGRIQPGLWLLRVGEEDPDGGTTRALDELGSFLLVPTRTRGGFPEPPNCAGNEHQPGEEDPNDHREPFCCCHRGEHGRRDRCCGYEQEGVHWCRSVGCYNRCGPLEIVSATFQADNSSSGSIVPAGAAEKPIFGRGD